MGGRGGGGFCVNIWRLTVACVRVFCAFVSVCLFPLVIMTYRNVRLDPCGLYPNAFGMGDEGIAGAGNRCSNVFVFSLQSMRAP